MYLATENNVTVLDVETGKVNDVDVLDSVLGGAAGIHFMLPYKGDQILLGIKGKGFFVYVPAEGSFRHVIRQQTLSAQKYVCFVDKDDRIWLSDGQSPVRTYNPKGVYIHFNPQGEDLQGEVSHLYFDKEGCLWQNMDGQLCCMDPETGDMISIVEASEPCRVSFIDSAGRLWAIFGQSDVRQYSLRKGKAVLEEAFVFREGVFSISEGKGGRIWLSSVRRIFVIDGDGAIETLRPEGSPAFTLLLSDPRTCRVFMFTVNAGLYEIMDDASVSRVETGDVKGISYVMTASDGSLWIGTYNEGVIRYDEASGSMMKIGKEEGMSDLSVRSILEDREGNIWFSTRSDVVKYDPASGKIATIHDDWYIDGRTYSLVSSACSPEGILFFGGSAGITRIDPTIPFPEAEDKVLALEQVFIDGKASSFSEDGLVLEHDDGMLSLRFAGLDYDSGPYLTYSYKMEGYDRNWTYVHGDGMAVYTRLPAGNYTFRARMKGTDGVWASEEIALPVKVRRQPVTPLVWVLLTSLVCALAYAVVYLRRRHDTKDTAQDEHQEKPEDEGGWYEVSSLNDADRIFIARIKDVIDSNLDSEKYTVNELARDMGMSYSSLYAKVKSLTGGTPQYLMTSHRMKKAEAFLKSGSFSVSEVAYKVGSSSPMTFSREFKKFFGYPPSQLLKEHQ